MINGGQFSQAIKCWEIPQGKPLIHHLMAQPTVSNVVVKQHREKRFVGWRGVGGCRKNLLVEGVLMLWHLWVWKIYFIYELRWLLF